MQTKTKKRTRDKLFEDSIQKKRKRACDRCHRLHKKCDGLFPCSNCKNKGIQCGYSENRLDDVVALQQEISRLKQQVTEYEEAHLECEIKYSTLVMSKSQNNEKIEKNQKSFESVILFNDTGLYICSMISKFIGIYFATCYPHHYLTTRNFREYLPEIYKVCVKNTYENTEMALLLYSIIANSAMIIGDARRGEEFYYKALEIAQHVDFKKTSYAVGCACCHLAYQNMCYEKAQDAYLFGKIAKNIAEQLNLTQKELMGEALLRIAYASGDYHEKLATFAEMWKRDFSTTCKLVGALGTVHTELFMGKNPDYVALANMVQKTMLVEPDDWKFLYNIYTNYLLAVIYHRSGLETMALQTADKILHLAENPDLRYTCIIVANAAMSEVADIHLDFRKPELVDKDLQIIGTLAHFPNGYNSFKRIHKRLVQDYQAPTLKLNLDPMSLKDDLEKLYPNQYEQFKEIQSIQGRNSSVSNVDLTQQMSGGLDRWIDNLPQKKEIAESVTEQQECPMFDYFL